MLCSNFPVQVLPITSPSYSPHLQFLQSPHVWNQKVQQNRFEPSPAITFSLKTWEHTGAAELDMTSEGQAVKTDLGFPEDFWMPCPRQGEPTFTNT